MTGGEPLIKSDTGLRIRRALIGLAAPVLVSGGLAALAPGAAYPLLKAFHLVAAITWAGGMVGLMGLLAWHVPVDSGSSTDAMLTALEREVLQRVVNPAMVVTWGIGLWLGWRGGWFSSPWLQAKLVLVLGLSGLHGWLVGAVRAFAQGRRIHEARSYRLVSFGGALAAIATVIIAVVKPM